MNTNSILFNLEEALEELTSTLNNIKSQPEYSEDEFEVAIAHLYHHINFAWNTRHVTEQEVRDLTDEKFSHWQRFPTDIVLTEPG